MIKTNNDGCIICGAQLLSRRADAKYCSKTCKAKGQSNRRAELVQTARRLEHYKTSSVLEDDEEIQRLLALLDDPRYGPSESI